MASTSPDQITQSFQDLHPTLRKNLLILARSMLAAGTVTLNKIKSHVSALTGRTGTAPDSHYKRLYRTVVAGAKGQIWQQVLTASSQLVGRPGRYLLLDGTSWEALGGAHHFMTLCSLVANVAVPIGWRELAKLGASNVAERIELLTQASQHYDLRGKILLADREYIGVNWFKALIDNEVDFVIRSRYLAYFTAIDAAPGPSVAEIIDTVRRSKKNNKAIRKRFVIQGLELWVVIAKNPEAKAKEDYMILLTNRDESPYQTVRHYLKRWKIEHCFKHLKSNGFDLERLNVDGLERQRFLVSMVVFCYAVAIRMGHRKYGAVGVKRYWGGKTYKAVSRFRFGRDWAVSRLLAYRQFLVWLTRQFKLGEPLLGTWIITNV